MKKISLASLALFFTVSAQAAPSAAKPNDPFQAQCWDATVLFVQDVVSKSFGTQFEVVQRLTTAENTYEAFVLLIPEHGADAPEHHYKVIFRNADACELETLMVDPVTP